MDLTAAEDIKKKWQEYMKNYTKKKKKKKTRQNLNDPDNHSGVISHLEPDILESEMKWPSLWTQLVEVMKLQLSYFKS